MKKKSIYLFQITMFILLGAARPKSTIHPLVLFNIMVGVGAFVVLTLWLVAWYRKKR
jgi:hypothetical protein